MRHRGPALAAPAARVEAPEPLNAALPRRPRITLTGGVTVKPGLVLFYSPLSGRSRRVEAFLAQVLQRRRNHDTFTVYRVDETKHPDLAERFRVRELPTLVVVERKTTKARLVAPRSGRDIERFLSPWLK